MFAPQDRVGVVVMNVGTPDAPRPLEVRRFLREFLSDPRVLDMSPVGRFILLHGVILPFRPRQSAEAYRAIWEPDGSPLLRHTRDLVAGLGERLGERYEVVAGMRYGRPSIASAFEELRAAGIDRVALFPLYPQFASSTTGTSVEEAFRVASSRWNVPTVAVVPPFYDDPGMLDAFAAIGRPVLADARADHVLFSFHGLPERHVLKADDTANHCLRDDDCCAAIGPANRNCYRAQCHHTAEGVASRLALADDGWTVSFQSRLGRTPWIRPYTDETVQRLAREGVRRLAVFCPAFVADCLETLEEIGIRARESFQEAGGQDLVLVPSLNADPGWLDTAARLVRTTCP